MYNSIAELLQSILDRYPDNTSREITESDVRFVTSNMSNFFYDRITDFYKTVHTTDANYTVQSQVVEGQNNLTDSVIVCDMISANRQLNFPSTVRKGNHILIYVRSMNGHSWTTNISLGDINGNTNQLRHGANLIFWDGSPSLPYIMFLGGGSAGTVEGNITLIADGKTSDFRIPHTLVTRPAVFSIEPISPAAQGIYGQDADNDDLIAQYSICPAKGSELIFNYSYNQY